MLSVLFAGCGGADYRKAVQLTAVPQGSDSYHQQFSVSMGPIESGLTYRVSLSLPNLHPDLARGQVTWSGSCTCVANLAYEGSGMLRRRDSLLFDFSSMGPSVAGDTVISGVSNTGRQATITVSYDRQARWELRSISPWIFDNKESKSWRSEFTYSGMVSQLRDFQMQCDSSEVSSHVVPVALRHSGGDSIVTVESKFASLGTTVATNLYVSIGGYHQPPVTLELPFAGFVGKSQEEFVLGNNFRAPWIGASIVSLTANDQELPKSAIAIVHATTATLLVGHDTESVNKAVPIWIRLSNGITFLLNDRFSVAGD